MFGCRASFLFFAVSLPNFAGHRQTDNVADDFTGSDTP
jgi:hypothetical protein